MTSWTRTKMKVIYDFKYGTGNTNPNNGGSYPVYGAGNIIGYYDKYNSEDAPVIGHMGANCGKVVFGKGKHFVTYNGVRALIKNGYDSMFGYYALLNSKLENVRRGSAQPYISYDLLNDLDIYLPDYEIQKSTANILTSFDDKIKLNRKMNEILEEMGRLFFRRWFVNFEFPWDFRSNKFSLEGRPYKSSGGEMMDGEFGKIPKGWEIKDMDSTFDFKGGAQPPKSTHIYERKKGYVRFIQNRDYASVNNLTYIKESSRNKLCDEFDILMDKYGEVGKIRCGIAGAYNVALAKIEPLVDDFREYLRGYFSQIYVQKTIESAATASTRGSLNKQVFLARKIIVPDKNVLKNFEQYSKTLLESYFIRNKEIAEITKLRDLLLPRLMSGKLQVPITK